MALCGEGSAFELVRVPEGDRAAWLAVRREGVGGSDVAAVMGLSPYRSPYEVWAEKVGLAEPADISGRPAVEWGNILEPVVGSHYAALHPDREVRRVNAVLRSLGRPWAQASLDYEVRDPGLGWGVLEIKTAGYRSAHLWEDGVPLHYQTQVAHYLDVTGRPFADVAVLIGGQDYREHRIVRDGDDVASVRSAVDAFWRLVEERREPPVTGMPGEGAALASAHPGGGGMVEADGVPSEVALYLSAKAALDAAKERFALRSSELKRLIGDADGIEYGGGRVRWVRGTARRFDRERFEADHPGVYGSYLAESPRDMGLRFTELKE